MKEKQFTEKTIQKLILAAVPSTGCRLLRFNSGMGWTGKVIRNKDGSITIHNPRPLITIVGDNQNKPFSGFSDLAGFTPVTITPDMVGKTLAVFTAIEVKDATNNPSEDQERFLAIVQRNGGYAGVARSVEDALKIIQNHPKT